MSDEPPSALGTLGPCPECGSERLIRREIERLRGGIGIGVVPYVDCGKCPTMRIELEAPGDAPS